MDRLAAEMAREPLPPLEREIIVVQSEGMQRWLTLELARRHGIAASLTTPFPRPFCRWLARRALDREDLPLSEAVPRGDDSSFGREMLCWRLFGLLGGLAESPAPADSAPAAYLAADPDQRKRFQLSERLGSLFDDYQMFRPDLLDAWQRGEATGARDAAAWQAEIWRLLAGSATDEEPFSRRLSRLTRRLAISTKEPEGLPRRIWVLGVSTLPPAFVALLAALSKWRPVGVLFVSPTYHYWGDLRSDREQAYLARRLRLSKHSRLGKQDDTASRHLERGNALLAALGRQGREFFDILQDIDPTGAAWHDLEFTDPADPVQASARPSALAQLQSDILHLIDREDPDGPGPVPWPVGDESLEIHACHAPMREMEVLKDRLLHAFTADPELRPSDVLVLVPDIELYGPYIQAVFGGENTASSLPFSIADRRAGKEQPPSETLLDILDLVPARVTVREIFDLLDTPAVRRRFGLEVADVPELRRLAEETRIRWGFDGDHRHRVFDVPLVEQNTWRAGLDRLVLGYATGEVETLVGSGETAVLPYSGDTAGAVEVLGRFTRFVDTLWAVLDDLRRPRGFEAWAEALLVTVDRLFEAESDDEERGLQMARDAADELRRLAATASLQATSAGTAQQEDIHLQVVREHLGTVLSAEGFASGFLAGRVTFCALRPMRTIPFRVIAIAGLNDGVFPRRDHRPGFDLMARARRPGDRSLRDDDRYLFLETLLAVRRRLILSYVGFSQRDATRREPSVVLSELLDQIDRTFGTDDGKPARRRVVVEHRLQPWSAAYFESSQTPSVPRSFDRTQCRAAEALRRSGDPVPPFVPEALTPQVEPELVTLSLEDLVRFWCHPPRAFCRHLGLALPDAASGGSGEDAEPFTVAGLEGFAVRHWLLERRLAGRGEALSEERDLLRARGLLPPGELGATAWQDLTRRVDEFLQRIPDQPRLAPADVDVRGGDETAGRRWRLGGRIDHRTTVGLLHYRCGAVRPDDLIRSWIEVLALAAMSSASGSGLGARLLGEDRAVLFEAPQHPLTHLDALVDGFVQGLRRPLPVAAETSLAWAEQERVVADPRRRAVKPPREAARQVFAGRFVPGPGRDAPDPEADDPYVRQCFRDLALPDQPDAGHWAKRLWWPIFDHTRNAS